MPRLDGWAPPTLASVEGLAQDTLVRCGCGRRAPAGSMYDYAPVPVAERPVRPAGDWGDRYVCCSCREDDFRTGRLPKTAYLGHLRAPADLVAKVRADRALPDTRRGSLVALATGSGSV